MSLSASWELQKTVHAALANDATLSSFVSARVFDRPPADVTYPYVTLGDTQVTSAEGGEAAIHKLTLVAWSRKNGRREAKEILAAIFNVLNEAPLALTGHMLVNLQFTDASLAYASQADALRGEISFRAYTESSN